MLSADDGEERTTAAYGTNYDRPIALKNKQALADLGLGSCQAISKSTVRSMLRVKE